MELQIEPRSEPRIVTMGRAAKVAVKNAIGFSGVKETTIRGGLARGVRMTLDFSGHTPMYLGMYEWELHGFFRRFLPETQRIYDIGGFRGYDALLFASNSPGQVYTFEPDPESAAMLRANIDLNPALRDRIEVKETPVARREAPGVTTIDSLSATLGAPDFIKIDIDGGELDALAGGIATLRESRPHLVVETHSKQLEDECGALLVECGYRPAIKHNRKIWREHRPIPHNRWLLAVGARNGR